MNSPQRQLQGAAASPIETIVRKGQERAGLMFRRAQYAKHELDQLLRDVVSLANAEMRGDRLIILGVDPDAPPGAHMVGFPSEHLVATDRYAEVVAKCIEPPLSVRYRSLGIEGRSFGVVIVDGPQDRPYMLKGDVSAAMRAGDSWVRADGKTRRLLRADFERMFAGRNALPSFRGKVELGFAGSSLAPQLRLPAIGPYKAPSQQLSEKLRTAIEAREMLERVSSSDTTQIRRLTHIRIFGPEIPYERVELDELRARLIRAADEYHEEDLYERFEVRGQRVNFQVRIGGTETLQGASLTIDMPQHAGIEIARRIHTSRLVEAGLDAAISRGGGEYPQVVSGRGMQRVTVNLPTIHPDRPLTVFAEPLRVVLTDKAVGERIALRMSLYAPTLAAPITETLTLIGAAPGHKAKPLSLDPSATTEFQLFAD